MEQFVIQGGQPLQGTITASGNKNAALKVLPACLLTDQPVILHNIPNIQDVRTLLAILKEMGVDVTDLGSGSWKIQAANIPSHIVPPELARHIRASFVLSGPMLARMGKVELPGPGGDAIGGRPLDTHIEGLRALGAEVEINQRSGLFIMSAPRGLRGAGLILQAEASVTATENSLMAAVTAPGETIIANAASEPHVQDLCNMLNQMGAQISGIGSNRLYISGVDKLQGTEFRIGADFMEVGSFIGLAAMTEGQVRIRRADPANMGMIRLVYSRLGVKWEEEGEDIIVPGGQHLHVDPTLSGRVLEIKPMPWPGFPPDLMSIAVVLATQAEGSVLLHDWMYESRFFFTDKLVFMGARIVMCDPHRVLIQGGNPLYANTEGVASPDIRAGMAMVLAALCAEGQTTIHNIHQIDRGYERIEYKLQQLGAQIERRPHQ